MASHIERRKFLATLGGAGCVAGRGERAASSDAGDWLPQQPIPQQVHRCWWAASRQGLGEMGFVEGRNLAIAFRFGRRALRPFASAGGGNSSGLPVTLPLFRGRRSAGCFAAKAATSTDSNCLFRSRRSGGTSASFQASTDRAATSREWQFLLRR